MLVKPLTEPDPIDLNDLSELPVSGREVFRVNPRSVRIAHVWLLILVLVAMMAMLTSDQRVGFYLVLLGVAGVIGVGIETVAYFGREGSITVDYERGVVVLMNMVYPLRFWDVLPKREVVIPFSSVLCVLDIRDRGGNKGGYIVTTRESRFTLSRTTERLDRAGSLLGELADRTEPAPLRRHFWVLCSIAGLAGCVVVALLGWLLGWV